MRRKSRREAKWLEDKSKMRNGGKLRERNKRIRNIHGGECWEGIKTRDKTNKIIKKGQNLERVSADDREALRERWRGRVLREREEGPLSVIQTEQTDSILEDRRLRAESSQGRQKAYSSLESSLDNTHIHTQS